MTELSPSGSLVFHFWDYGDPIYLEFEYRMRDDEFMVEVDEVLYTRGDYDPELMCRMSPCNPTFGFKITAYNELTQNYEIPINDTLTADENLEPQQYIYEYWCDQSGPDV